MKHDKSDLRLLLGILLIVSLSIGMIYASNESSKPIASQQPAAQQVPPPPSAPASVPIIEVPKPPAEVKSQVPPDEHPFANLSPSKAADLLEIFEAAQDVDKMAEVLKGLTAQKAAAIAKEVIDDKTSPLTRDDMVEFLYALALNYPNDVNAQSMILDLIADRSPLLQGAPFLLVAARSQYPQIIPPLLSWAQSVVRRKGEAQTPREIALLVQEGLEQSVLNNEPQSLETMFKQGVPILKDYASRLLWLVVEGNKKLAFVKLLVDRGASINHSAKGYSLIAKAVENENFEMIKTIVEVGGKKLEIDAIYNPAVGTALQIAIQKGYSAVDEYLREHGALEDAPLRTQKVKKRSKNKSQRGKN